MKITFAAMIDGVTVGTRSSGTMAYQAVLVVWSEQHNGWTDLSWHLTHDAAHKAVNGKHVAARYPRRQVVDAVPVRISGMVKPGSPNADVWAPLADAAIAYSAAEQGRKRDAALAEALAEVAAAETVDAPTDDVDVQEPIVSVSAAGDTEPVDGLRRPIVKATREAMAACAAVGLSYWSGHPAPGHVWAVDGDQQAHPVRIDRKRGLAIIAEPNDAIGGNPLVSWSIDGPAEPVLSDATAELVDAAASDQDISPEARAVVAGQDDPASITLADMLGALGDRAIVAHIGAEHLAPAAPPGPGIDVAASHAEMVAIAEAALPTERLSVPKLGNLEAVNAVIAQQAAEAINANAARAADVDAPAALSVTARKAVLASMLGDAIDKMIANASEVDRAALAMTDAQIHGQIKSWLRRSGRALIYGDGKGVSGGDAD